MKNIPSDMGKVRDEWIADLLVVHGGLKSGSISKIEREPMGEGIGQVGEFCKLVVTSNQDERFSYFLKLRPIFLMTMILKTAITWIPWITMESEVVNCWCEGTI